MVFGTVVAFPHVINIVFHLCNDLQIIKKLVRSEYYVFFQFTCSLYLTVCETRTVKYSEQNRHCQLKGNLVGVK